MNNPFQKFYKLGRGRGRRTKIEKYGDGAKGWPEGAPFDRVILTCAPAEISATLLNQLKTGGIMVAPEGRDRAQTLVTITRTETGFEKEELLPVKFVPLVEG
ncbi:MAG: protein-L-isoaspartate O-methyltransferase family protein [Candidatus Puniceispirillaceae bacterium]